MEPGRSRVNRSPRYPVTPASGLWRLIQVMQAAASAVLSQHRICIAVRTGTNIMVAISSESSDVKMILEIQIELSAYKIVFTPTDNVTITDIT